MNRRPWIGGVLGAAVVIGLMGWGSYIDDRPQYEYARPAAGRETEDRVDPRVLEDARPYLNFAAAEAVGGCNDGTINGSSDKVSDPGEPHDVCSDQSYATKCNAKCAWELGFCGLVEGAPSGWSRCWIPNCPRDAYNCPSGCDGSCGWRFTDPITHETTCSP